MRFGLMFMTALAAVSLGPRKAWAAETSQAAKPSETLAPQAIEKTEIPYPEGARGDSVVRLVVVVGVDGMVRNVEPEAGEEPFLAAARSGVTSWRFRPALRDGRAVAAKIRLEIVFREPQPAPESAPMPAGTSPLPAGDGTSGAPVPSTRSEEAPPRSVEPIEVVVLGDRAEPGRSVSMTRAEVRELPGAFGDPFRALEALPGVTPIISGLPFFFVRGAPPGNVGYFLDGIRLPVLFHVGIGPAVVHPGLIDHVDLYPGGYPARFGRFAGGILAGETALPAAVARGEFNVRLFDAGALVEAPVARGRGSALVGGRYSYTALLLSLLSSEIALDYWDYQLRVGYDVSQRDRLSAFLFGSYDYLGEKTPTRTLTLFGTQFHRGDLRYDRALGGGGNLRTAVMIGVDASETDSNRSVRNQLLGARSELVLPLSVNAKLRAGVDLLADRYTVDLGLADLPPSAAEVASYFPSRTDLVMGVRADVPWVVTPRFEVTPGVRVDLFGSDGATALGVDPRLATRVNLTPRLSMKSAFGVVHQPPAFVLPLPGFQPGGLRGGLQRAVQESVGIEAQLGAGTLGSLTLFQNAFFNMNDSLGSTSAVAGGCPPGAFASDSLAGDPGRSYDEAPPCGPRFDRGTLGADLSGGAGHAGETDDDKRNNEAFSVRTLGAAYGLELYLRRKLADRIGGFVSYTLSRSTRSYRNRRYAAAFDRTHVLNAAVALKLGRGWSAGARGVFYTGLPRAPSPGSSARLPYFLRFDFRAEKRWQLSRNSWLALVAEWMNATLSKEAVSSTCTLSGCEAEEIGPITIPSLGLEGGF